ncbi:hypothetical protein NDU88_006503 [Pleurodeles waltl]|uniref:Reverse transcriptase domain-containing protein n=1 Tax=Pleurodeles waltl TaxID=8319 RepID=A0AAV7WEZ8_PLEWA|nr:hypothetical protein NDU88_006503 [Pleurodeles waltl]
MEASPPPSPATVEQEEASMEDKEHSLPSNLEEKEPKTNQEHKPAPEKHQVTVAKTAEPAPETRQEPNQPCERQELFQCLRPQLVTSRTIAMGRDFNCILERGGRCGSMAGEGWMDDAAKLLAEMVGEASLTDVIGFMGPDARNFTWSHPDGFLRSRIDFVFTSKSVVRPGCPHSPSLFVLVIELLAEYIRKNPNIRGIPTPGDAKKEVKYALYMDDVTLFCTDGKSVQSLLEACKDFGEASGAKINVDKSQAKLFGCWDLCNKPLPFPIEAGLVKILSICFGGPEAAEKSWNERLTKVKQKLGLWSLRHLSIEGKALVLRNDTWPVLQYVTQAWPLLANGTRAVNRMVFHFVWHSKMDRVKKSVMHKEHRKGGKAFPDIPTILRAFFVCGCVRIILLNEKKDHSAYRVFHFFLLLVWKRLGWDKWENATLFN